LTQSFPNARILSWGGRTSTWEDSKAIEKLGRNMQNTFSSVRVGSRPVVFIGFEVGGLVRDANNKHTSYILFLDYQMDLPQLET